MFTLSLYLNLYCLFDSSLNVYLKSSFLFIENAEHKKSGIQYTRYFRHKKSGKQYRIFGRHCQGDDFHPSPYPRGFKSEYLTVRYPKI